MSYKPETKFQITDDGKLVYNLKQDGWDNGNPRMVNDVWISINAPKDNMIDIASVIMQALNQAFKPTED